MIRRMRGGVGRRRARRLDGVGRPEAGALTAQRTLRSRSTIWVVAEFMPRVGLAERARRERVARLADAEEGEPAGRDSLVKLPFATTEPTSRPLLGLTIFKSIATDPVARLGVLEGRVLAVATPAPGSGGGVCPRSRRRCRAQPPTRRASLRCWTPSPRQSR